MATSSPESSNHPASDGFVRLLSLEQCPLDRGVFVEAAGKELAVFRCAEPPEVYVLDNACPHANGNLSAGEVENGMVRCPWHGWTFHLDDGRSARSHAARVNCYPVEIRGRDIYVRL